MYHKNDQVEVTATEGRNKDYKGVCGTVQAHVAHTQLYILRLDGRSGHILMPADDFQLIRRTSGASGAP